jgi:quercetin dioxygenase-like cupin family protein
VRDLATAIAELEGSGYRLDMITPADDPTTAMMSRDGETVEVTGESRVGRAGMEYRDLVPDRLGGRIIASRIAIPDGGPVPDSVHFHELRFQVIVCTAGWVRVVYEDQGPPFVLGPGDVVLQPPGIRHRVLEASPGLEVVELAAPAQHPTWFDHSLELPTPGPPQPARTYGAGQRFVRTDAVSLPWEPCADIPGWEARETPVAEATDGLASVRHLRPAPGPPPASVWSSPAETFVYVTAGAVTVHTPGADTPGADLHLATDDALVLPADTPHTLTPVPAATTPELLAITLPP